MNHLFYFNWEKYINVLTYMNAWEKYSGQGVLDQGNWTNKIVNGILD